MQHKPDVTPRTPHGVPAEIITVPPIIKSKGIAQSQAHVSQAHVSHQAHVRMDPRILERIHDVVAVLRHDYTDVLAGQTNDLKKACSILSDNQQVATKKIYDISHEIRGIAGTFARPLAGQIAAHICDTLDDPLSSHDLTADQLKEKVDVLVQIANLSPEPEGFFASVVLERLSETPPSHPTKNTLRNAEMTR